MTLDRIQAWAGEGVGLPIPKRHPLHEDPEWYQRDLDQEPDAPDVDPLPTARHRQIPDPPTP